MALTIIIVFLSLIGLIAMHEFGHFILARFFGVKVEEFGIFLPPRIFGKKIGDTVYSLNVLPLGAFVKLQGEEERVESSSSFTSKPVWQRALIVAGGVISFWLIAIVLLSYVYATGAIQVVSDSDSAVNPQVQIAAVSSGSPAAQAGILPGDTVESLKVSGDTGDILKVDKVAQIQDFTNVHKGQPIVIEIRRGAQALDLTLTPRENPPAGEGSVGIALVRTAKVTYSWWQAIGKGFGTTWDLTIGVFTGWGQIIGRFIHGQGMPPGTQFVGPIGIGSLLNQAAQMGFNYYLQFVAIISVYLAIFNALPIPALDGGKLVFLGIEAARKRPVSEKVEQTVTAAFFFILIAMSVFATIGDISRLFG
jgi:regulator of sigma E protease